MAPTSQKRLWHTEGVNIGTSGTEDCASLAITLYIWEVLIAAFMSLRAPKICSIEGCIYSTAYSTMAPSKRANSFGSLQYPVIVRFSPSP